MKNVSFCVTDFFLLHSLGEGEESTESEEPFNHDPMQLWLQKFAKYVYYSFVTSTVNFQKT